MFSEIALFLLDTVFTLFGMALLLRVWMQLTRLPTRNAVSQGVFQITDWLVRPLRRIIPGLGGIDLLGFLPAMLLTALLYVLKWAISLVMWVTLLMAILSWVNPHSPVTPAIDHLTAPVLRPIQRVVPRLGGFDVSPLVLFVIAQILLMVVARLGASVFNMHF